MNETWFIELVKLQQRQDSIDRQENSFLTDTTGTNIYGTITAPEVSSKKAIGRPPTHWSLINEVLRLYDCSLEEELNGGKRLSLRAIQAKMNRRVKYLTVRRILKTYRADTYSNKKKG